MSGEDVSGEDVSGEDAAAATPRKPCPICRKPSVEAYTPFCSARCRNVDLGRWLTGTYAVPTEEPPEEEG